MAVNMNRKQRWENKKYMKNFLKEAWKNCRRVEFKEICLHAPWFPSYTRGG